jgi:putative transposase
VPKVGEIKTQYHREIPHNAKIKTLTVSKEGTKWFVSFSVEIPHEIEPKPIKSAIGIDLGLIYFYKASDGSEVKVPKHFRKSQGKLKKLQRKRSNAKKRSERYYKLLRAVQRVHHKIKNQRLDFLHKTAHCLLEKADAVILEDLNTKGLSRRPKPRPNDDGSYAPNGASRKAGLNKSILDASWDSFKLILEYKASFLGKKVEAVAPHYTSQKCSSCGEIVKKSLSTRTQRCTECGLVMDRDENAAVNVLGLGMGFLGFATLEAPTITHCV